MKGLPDHTLFGEAAILNLRQAARDYFELRSKAYPEISTLKLVGDRYQLHERQRIAIKRSVCPQDQKHRRLMRRQHTIQGNKLGVDALNCLITLETAHANGVILRGNDRAYRDLAGIHGAHKIISKTGELIRELGLKLNELAPSSVEWWIDKPVRSSGKICDLIRSIAQEKNWNWHVHLVPDPDQILINYDGIVASSDGGILNRCHAWMDLPGLLLKQNKHWIVDFSMNE